MHTYKKTKPNAILQVNISFPAGPQPSTISLSSAKFVWAATLHEGKNPIFFLHTPTPRYGIVQTSYHFSWLVNAHGNNNPHETKYAWWLFSTYLQNQSCKCIRHDSRSVAPAAVREGSQIQLLSDWLNQSTTQQYSIKYALIHTTAPQFALAGTSS